MIVSLAFSGVIYRSASFEIERFANNQRTRFERRINPLPLIDHELIEETKHRILMTLFLINLGIFSIAGLLGYYLSGKTLSPIQEMLDEQYRFVSDASHELKTPITAIKTTLEVAIRDKEMKIREARQTLQTSLEEVNRLQKLAEGLLELTHKNGVGELVTTMLDSIIINAINTLEPLSRFKKIEILNKSSHLVVMADETSLARALVAILDNAIKYSKKNGKIEITVKIVDKKIILTVTDNGVGIEEDALPYVFDRFYRSDPARSEKGYGLGLSIAKQIIEAHNGKIFIDSEINKGTKVVIALPYSAKLQKKDLE